MFMTIIGIILLIAGIVVTVAGLKHAMGGADEDEAGEQYKNRSERATIALFAGGAIAFVGFVLCLIQVARHFMA